jgi:hypothetical protein
MYVAERRLRSGTCVQRDEHERLHRDAAKQVPDGQGEVLWAAGGDRDDELRQVGPIAGNSTPPRADPRPSRLSSAPLELDRRMPATQIASAAAAKIRTSGTGRNRARGVLLPQTP